MNTRLGILFLATAVTLAACGGGGSSSGGGNNPIPTTAPSTAPTSAPTTAPTHAPTTPPTTAPTSPPTTAPQPKGNIPIQDPNIGGSAAFVDPATHHTLYWLDNDGPNGVVCTTAAGCTPIWPPMTASAGSAGTGNMTVVTRSDGTKQWAYQGHPLYHYVGDSGADQNNGNLIPEPGTSDIWHTARPAAASPSPTGQPCMGPYC